jgi:hypothetical protein
MLKASGKISVEKDHNRIVVDISRDFVNYYYWFISKRYWIKMNTPMHGAHITIYNNVVNKHEIDWQAAKGYHKQSVDFEYDPYIIEGGYKKGFIMYYLKVYSREIEGIKAALGIKDGDRYRGLHITLANSKNGTIKPDWPQMITIK